MHTIIFGYVLRLMQTPETDGAHQIVNPMPLNESFCQKVSLFLALLTVILFVQCNKNARKSGWILYNANFDLGN